MYAGGMMSLRSRRASVRASRWSVFTFTRAMACRASVWASVSLIAYARKRSTSQYLVAVLSTTIRRPLRNGAGAASIA